jgi:hypothetical protein
MKTHISLTLSNISLAKMHFELNVLNRLTLIPIIVIVKWLGTASDMQDWYHAYTPANLVGAITDQLEYPILQLGSQATNYARTQIQSDEGECAHPVNPIVMENCSPGTDEWTLKRFNNDIEGYAFPASINVGDTVRFYVNTNAAHFSLIIYRSGYYGGLGGRLVKSVANVEGRVQPTCNQDFSTGLISCANWSPSYALEVPADWVSGVYIAKLTRQDTGGENVVVFTVRDDKRKSDILFQQSLFTYQAYNNYGGKATYTSLSDGCPTIAQTPRAVKVSFARPIVISDNTGGLALNSYFRAEYPMVRWLEAQGYDVTYSTTLDTHRSGKPGAPNHLLDHRVFLSVGHDEYWTQEMRNAITAARDAGVHLGFFSANTSYWRVRLEPDPFTGEPDSVMVTYKTTESGPPDPSGHPTGTWRDPTGVNNPENGLLGVEYIGDNDAYFFPMRVTTAQAADRIYRHTDLQTMPPNTYAEFGAQTVGWEWDAVVDNGHTPPGLEVLAASPVYGLLLQDAGNFRNGNLGKASANMTRYRAPSGAIVFSSGTIQWSWGLGAWGTDVVEPDKYLPQITYNILADMQVQPATSAKNLVLDGQAHPVVQPPATFLSVDSTGGPVISNLRTTLSGNVVTVTWDTDLPSTSQVFFGEQPEHLINASRANRSATRTHSVTRGIGFQYNSRYYYRAISVDERGHVTFSEIGSFQTQTAPLKTQVGDIIRSVATPTGCWAEANPSSAIGVVGTATVIVAGSSGFLIVRRRRKRRQVMPH